MACRRCQVFSFFVLLAFLYVRAGAEEAITRDGQRLQGKLLGTENRLRFVPAGQQTLYQLDQLDQIRFPTTDERPCLLGTFYHITFADRQRLTGELVGLDGQELQIRTPWGKLHRISRGAVRAITQPDGYLPLVDEGFESDLAAWKVTGAVALDSRQHLSGRHSLLLSGSGQAEMTLPRPLASGRAGIHFFDGDKARGARWQVELLFLHGKETRLLRIRVGGDTHYGVEPSGTPGELGRLARSNGWHCLDATFAPEGSQIAIDNRVLWAGRLERDAVLSKVRVACVALQEGRPAEGSLWFDDFTLARAVEVLRHEDADPRQDEVWLASGDQLLGDVVRADRRSVELVARYGKRTLSWSEVRGIFLRQGKELLPKAEPGQARVWLRAATGSEPDQLVGQVRSLTEHRLTLRHAFLGDLEIDRPWLRRMASIE